MQIPTDLAYLLLPLPEGGKLLPKRDCPFERLALGRHSPEPHPWLDGKEWVWCSRETEAAE